MAPPVLAPRDAKAFYDRFGARQDTQAFYEDAAVDALVAHAELGEAHALVEFGCGTGRHAARLLAEVLAPDARYVGIDLSTTMVGLARARLARFADRATLVESTGTMRLPLADRSCDRLLSTFVLDLLSPEDTRELLAEAHRVLVPGGLLCLTSATHGEDLAGRLVSAAVSAVHALRPALLGGCRPIAIRPLLAADAWALRHHERVRAWGVTSEVVVAARR